MLQTLAVVNTGLGQGATKGSWGILSKGRKGGNGGEGLRSGRPCRTIFEYGAGDRVGHLLRCICDKWNGRLGRAAGVVRGGTRRGHWGYVEQGPMWGSWGIQGVAIAGQLVDPEWVLMRAVGIAGVGAHVEQLVYLEQVPMRGSQCIWS